MTLNAKSILKFQYNYVFIDTKFFAYSVHKFRERIAIKKCSNLNLCFFPSEPILLVR